MNSNMWFYTYRKNLKLFNWILLFSHKFNPEYHHRSPTAVIMRRFQ